MIKNWIDAAAARWTDACYLEDAGGAGQLTFAGLQRSTRAWARYLDRAGVAPGSRVALRLPDPLGYASALIAILGAGRVVVPLDPAAPAAELARVFEVARPQAVVTDGGLAPSLPGPSLPGRGLPGRGLPGRGLPGRGLPTWGLPTWGLPAWGLPVLTPPGPDEAGELGQPGGATSAGGIFLCTSGTTGAPKGVLLRESQLSHVAGCVAIHHRLTPADRGYCCLPLFHVNAEVVGLLATLAARACLVLDRRFSPHGFWATVEEQQITWINAVPAIITILAREPDAPRTPGRIRFVRSASAPLPPSASRRFEQRFGVPIIETYGMTEAASMITTNPLDGPRKPGSAGRPAGAQVRVVQQAGGRYVPCSRGTVGQVQIRGRGVISAYAAGGRPGAIGPDGWLDTGDLGHLDSDGYLFLAGRSDDVINRGGEKIYPREIEDFLVAQPGVRSAAVVAARDEVLGQVPVAFVVPAGPGRPDHLPDAKLEQTLRAACAAALPRFKRPTAFHLVHELPLGPGGKVARRRLQALAAAHRAPESGAAA